VIGSRQRFGGNAQILREQLALGLAGLVVAGAQDRRRVDRRDDDRCLTAFVR